MPADPGEIARRAAPVPAEEILERPPEPPRGWPPGFAGDDADRGAALVLASLQGIKPRELRVVAWREGSAGATVDAIRGGRAGSEGDRRFAAAADPGEIRRGADACGARLGFPGDPEYPPDLLDLHDPPVAVFVRGRPLGEAPVRVAMVGARTCSRLGRDVAVAIAAELAGLGVCIVSGAAHGIDRASHEGALRARGPTVAVLGCGIDVRYPRSSGALLAQIEQRGTLLSEYPPGVVPDRFRFPARNRIVAALAKVVVVVEGGDRSGSLITTDHAAGIGRQVCAVPGPITNPLTRAPHALIREGAALVRGASDVLVELGLDPAVLRVDDDGSAGVGILLDEREAAVLAVLTAEQLPEDVARAADLPLPRAMAILTELELKGLVRVVGGRVNRVPVPRMPTRPASRVVERPGRR